MTKPKEAYAIVDDNGRILIDCISHTELGCKRRFCYEWSYWNELGYTCQKVIITVDSEKISDKPMPKWFVDAMEECANQFKCKHENTTFCGGKTTCFNCGIELTNPISK